jgi:DNA-binding FadR family transcriptional regulator
MAAKEAISTGENTGGRRQPVRVTAERMRERIFARGEGEQIGSLPDLARDFGVGIVTVQQAARILEHEGLLEVRRGPGGGYYGRRPDAASLERSLAAYMRTEPASWKEALDMTSLLFNELCAAAADCSDRALQDDLRGMAQKLTLIEGDGDVAELELEFQDILFRMVNRPLFELLTRVTLRFAQTRPDGPAVRGAFEPGEWKSGRRRIIDAILRQDRELARFEADRSNRRILLAWMGQERR